MTPTKFKSFTKKHKVVQTKDVSQFGFVLVFDNAQTIRVGVNYDGLTYTHESEEYKGDSRQLMKDLQKHSKGFVEKMIEKYSDNGNFNESLLKK